MEDISKIGQLNKMFNQYVSFEMLSANFPIPT